MSTYGRTAWLSPRYSVEFPDFPALNVAQASRETAARCARVVKHFPVRIKITFKGFTYSEDRATICYGCRARVSLWEQDCDGPHDTVCCGVCDWWTAVNIRDMSDHRERKRIAAQAALRAGC